MNLEYFQLMFSIVMSAILAVHDVVAEVMVQVAALAPAAKVFKIVVVFVAIYVGRGEHHFASCFRMWPAIGRTAFRELG